MKIDKETATKLYPESPDWFKEQLEEEFGTEAFLPNCFTAIKTFEGACKKLGISPETVVSKTDTSDEVAYKKLKVIVKAINDGWEPDWNNTNQQKWYPWFVLSSGFGFLYSSYGYGRSDTFVGSRLCFETEEQSDYAAKQFIDLYKQLLTI